MFSTIYDCPTIDRSKLSNIPPTLDKLAKYDQLPTFLNQALIAI